MKLPKFTKETKNEQPIPPWMDELAEGDFISCNTTYVMGGYWNLFDECYLPCEEKGDIRYYVYNPIKYGAPADKKYPVMMWIHGLNCAIDGIRCVGYCGAEQYASKAYQEALGGGAIPIASGYVPNNESLKKIEASGVHLLIVHSRHDEMTRFDECIAPREEELQGLDNCLCFFPEWIRNEDKGVASVNYGIEMGQHCIINPVQANLIYNDGTCYDERLSKGVTGWIKDVVEK